MKKSFKPDRRDEIALPFAIRGEINAERWLVESKNSLVKFYFLALFLLAVVIFSPHYLTIFHIDVGWMILPWLAFLIVLIERVPQAKKDIKAAHTTVEMVKIEIAQGKYKDACSRGCTMDMWREYTDLLHAEGLKASDH